MTTGEKIRELRKRLGLTQEELGNMIGVKKAAINKYETGVVVNLKRSTIAALAKALGVSPVELLSPEGIPPDQPRTVEARSFAKGMDKLPQQERERILNMFIAAYPGIFEKGTDDHDS